MRSHLSRGLLLSFALVMALAGCGKTKSETASTTTSSDSLVAANPQEQAPGNITPQSGMPQQQPPAETAPAPAPARTTTHTTTRHTTGGGTTTTTHHTTHTPSGGTSGSTAEAGTTVPSGTPVAVTVNTLISSETAKEGDTWTGVVKSPVMVNGVTVIPAGSTVSGTVTTVTPAAKGSRATLGLAMSSVEVNGQSYNVHGTTEDIVAGSTRARNLGAIAGGAAAGAIIGRAVGGSGKGALIGGLIGGAAAGGAVAKSKGYQVVLKEGTSLTFTTTTNASIRS